MYPRPQDYIPPSGDEFVPKRAHFLNTVFVGIFATAAAGVVAWLFALGGVDTIKDSIDRAQFSQSPPWLTLASPHQHVADSAVLTLGDLPPGWVLANKDDADTDEGDVDLEISEGCKELEKQVDSQGAMASAQSDRFRGPDKQILRSGTDVFAGPGEAQGALEFVRGLFAQCGNDLVNAFNEGIRRGAEKRGASPSAIQVSTALHDLGPPSVGESGFVYRIDVTLTGPGGSVNVAVDFIFFRHGRLASGLVYTAAGGASADAEQQLMQIAAAKLQAANASFPEA
jgi:hypothetical protein